MQSADPIAERTDGQVGAQTSKRLSVPRVQDVNRQLLARIRREIVEFGASGVPGESFDLGHDENLLFWWTGWRL